MGAQETVRELYKCYRAHLPEAYRWEDEKDRWHELIFCVFKELSGVEDVEARRIVGSLSSLRLLDAVELGKGVTESGELDRAHHPVPDLLSIIALNGISVDKSERLLLSICRIAKGLNSKYRRPLHFLRKYGDMMVDELDSLIPEDVVCSQTRRRIFVTWLQNTLEMPIPMRSRELEAFCTENGCTLEDLVAAADQSEFNVAVVDDLVQLSLIDEEGQNRIRSAA